VEEKEEAVVVVSALVTVVAEEGKWEGEEGWEKSGRRTANEKKERMKRRRCSHYVALDNNQPTLARAAASSY